MPVFRKQLHGLLFYFLQYSINCFVSSVCTFLVQLYVVPLSSMYRSIGKYNRVNLNQVTRLHVNPHPQKNTSYIDNCVILGKMLLQIKICHSLRRATDRKSILLLISDTYNFYYR